MKIAVVIAGNGKTGAPRRLLSLAHQFKLAGADSYIVSYEDHEINEVARYWKVPFEILRTPRTLRKGVLSGGVLAKSLNFIMIFLFWFRQVKFFGHKKYDAIIFRSSLTGLLYFPVYMLWGRKIILDLDYEIPGGFLVSLSRRISFYFCAAIVAQYSSVLEEISSEGKTNSVRDKFFSILPGIDFLPLAGKKRGRAKNLASDPFLISQIGSICDRKNQLFSLKLIKNLVSDPGFPPVILKLVGGVDDKDYMRVLLDYVEQNGLEEFVEFSGWSDDVPAIMAASDFLLMPSKNEGVPNTIQEAMYLGVPVVASEVGGIPDVIINGQSGFIIPLSNFDEWRRCISLLIFQPGIIDDFSYAARERACKNFTLSHWSASYLAVITSNVL